MYVTSQSTSVPPYAPYFTFNQQNVLLTAPLLLLLPLSKLVLVVTSVHNEMAPVISCKLPQKPDNSATAISSKTKLNRHHSLTELPLPLTINDNVMATTGMANLDTAR